MTTMSEPTMSEPTPGELTEANPDLTIGLTPEGLAALEDCRGLPLEGEPEDCVPEGFVPDTAEKVDWVIGKVADARDRAARVRENAEKIAKQHEADAAFFEWKFGPQMQTWARQETEGTRRKSVTLFSGTVGFRKKPGTLQITDTGAAMAWARQSCPQAVTERLEKEALAKTLRTTGEEVDWGGLTPDEEVFYIR